MIVTVLDDNEVSERTSNKKSSVGNYSPTAGVTVGYGSGTYNPRLTCPDKTDKNWIQRAYGGTNMCVLGPLFTRYSRGSVLPNCTGYAWGRVYELCEQWNCELPTSATGGNYKNYPKNYLCINQAGVWYRENKRVVDASNGTKGYAYGSVPRLGSVAVFEDGDNGHVAIVEQIEYSSNGQPSKIVISESNYGKTPVFRTAGIIKVGARYRHSVWNNEWLVGYIYPPYVAYYDKTAGEAYGNSTLNQVTTITVINYENGKWVYTQVPVGSDYTPKESGLPSYPSTDEELQEELAKEMNTKIINVGDTVTPIKSGNSSKMGTGKEVVANGGQYNVKSYFAGYPYSYGIGTDSATLGFFSEDGLKIITHRKIKVVLDLDYDTEQKTRNYEVTYGNNMFTPPNPIRIGYKFEGWYYRLDYTSTGTTNMVKFSFDTKLTKDIHLYAGWSTSS